MDLFANELSIHEQFHNISSFRTSLSRLMTMRNAAHRANREVYCHRALLTAKPIPGKPMQQVIGHLPANEQRAAMVWLTHSGPFWDDDDIRRHDSKEWLECQDNRVTESAIGEAAFRKLHGDECGLISVRPSKWDFSPVEVTWRWDVEGLDDQHTELDNWCDPVEFEEMLLNTAPPILSWDELRQTSISRFENLTFAKDCFDPLYGYPFAKSTAERFTKLLSILDRLKRTFNASGERNPEGRQIYQDYFTGDRALFSDSSETEKHDFDNELTFPHPDSPGEQLICTWHGKVSYMARRLHFSWPIRANEPVYIVYAGPKITKR